MAGLLTPPQLFFIDQDGGPLAGGLLYTYVPGTTTPKTTFQDAAESTANTNPITLDVRGACVVYGDGQYRLVLQDAFGAQIFDLLSDEPLPASAIGAILPCLGQPTLQAFRDCDGTTAAIAQAIANVQLLPGTAGPTGPTGPAGPAGDAGPTGPGGSGGTASRGNPSFFADPSTGYMVAFGNAVTDGTGVGTVTFARLFTQIQSVVCTPLGGGINLGSGRVEVMAQNVFSVFFVDTSNHGAVPGVQFSWVASGFYT